MRTPVLLLALALPLAACDSDATSGATGGPSSGLVTAQIAGAAPFTATTATATLGQDWSLDATDASGRMIKILTEKSQTGTFPITQFNALGYCTSASTCAWATSGTLTVSAFTLNQSARGSFSFSGTLGGQAFTVTNGTFDVKQGTHTK